MTFLIISTPVVYDYSDVYYSCTPVRANAIRPYDPTPLLPYSKKCSKHLLN
ncbi:MAG: hypothetical protein SWX82_11720 [Cyanobacteriota bacterium]|nr:hypothetical protein [Cyanobacteriota bacterium]